MRLFYSLLWYLLLPLLFLRLWLRGRRSPAYRKRWKERLAWGYRPGQLSESIWVHAVSVGETLAAAGMIEQLLKRYPDTPLLVTTTTPTGSERVRALFGDRVHHVYCPWELPGALRRFIRAFRPRLVIVLETELWPNLAAAAKAGGARLMLMNGRLSEKSFRGYSKFPRLVAPMLQRFDALLVQTPQEVERFIALGARPETAHAIGSVKFDLSLSASVRQRASQLRQKWGERPVWLAASTHPGEDELMLAAHRLLLEQCPEALLVIVPRHPERFDDVAALVRGQAMGLARRSREQSVSAATAVYLADTMGELLMLFGCCDVAFVGGSMVPVGGHNVLEPAAWGKPVLIGQHMHNFSAIAALLMEAGGCTAVQDEQTLASQLQALLSDPGRRQQQGEAAAAVVEANRGALERALDKIDEQVKAISH